MNTELDYYKLQGAISSPASLSHLFEQLPGQIEELVRIVQGCDHSHFLGRTLWIKNPA